jgi:hypothetical protein
VVNNKWRGLHPVHTLRGRARLAAFLLFTSTGGAAAWAAKLIRSWYDSVSTAHAILSAQFNRDDAPDPAQANDSRNTVTILIDLTARIAEVGYRRCWYYPGFAPATSFGSVLTNVHK